MGEKKEEVRIIYNQGCPDWMLTFGDCMSLLLCFFVMLMTFSTPDESKLMEVIGGLQGALGVVEPPIAMSNKLSMTRPSDKEEKDGRIVRGDDVLHKVDPEEMSPINLRDIKIKNRFNTFTEELHNAGFKNIVAIQQMEDGLLVEMPFDALFSQSSDEMKPGASKWMEPFAGLLETLGNEARIIACIPRGESISLAKKRLDALCFCLSSRYKVKADRISVGLELSETAQRPTMKALIADKFQSRELSLADFFKSGAR